MSSTETDTRTETDITVDPNYVYAEPVQSQENQDFIMFEAAQSDAAEMMAAVLTEVAGAPFPHVVSFLPNFFPNGKARVGVWQAESYADALEFAAKMHEWHEEEGGDEEFGVHVAVAVPGTLEGLLASLRG